MKNKKHSVEEVVVQGRDPVVVLAFTQRKGWTLVANQHPDAQVQAAIKAVNAAIWSQPSFGSPAIEIARKANRILQNENETIVVVAR